MPEPEVASGPPVSALASVWERAARLAAWAPDEARELLADASPEGDVLDVARLAELLGRVFAVTGAWELAAAAFTDAAATWTGLDEQRAAALAALAAALPLAPFTSDDEALAAELAVIARCLDPEAPPPIVERAIVELRRALVPRQVIGRLEATCGLAPLEVALLMAAAAPILAPGLPSAPVAAWAPLLEAASLTAAVDLDRLVALGLLQPGPALVPAPALVSRLLGRTTVEAPLGGRLRRIAPGPPPPDAAVLARALVLGGGVAVVVGPAGTGRAATVARVVAERGLGLFEAQLGGRASDAALTGAAVEARLHDGLLVVDLDAWDAPPLELLVALAPIAVVTTTEPALPDEVRAFTLTASDEVGSAAP